MKRNTYLLSMCAIFVIFSLSCLLIFLKDGQTTQLPGHEYERREFGQIESLRIIVIVYNRAKSLMRLLNSLNGAKYDSDEIMLEVWIDRSINGNVDQITLQTARNFSFTHGSYSVNVHPKHVGIFGQWVTTWKPKENGSEIAVILEDDLTVSPYFYKYLKLVHNMYDEREEVNGYSLQGVTIKHHVTDSSRLVAPKESVVFLYPVIGTWGFSPNRRSWMKFVEWCTDAVKNSSLQPLVPGNIASEWYKQMKQQRRGDAIWSIWHIYYAWKHNEMTLYPNLEGNLGLTINWREKGLHYSGKEGGATNGLLTEWKDEYERLPFRPVHLDIKGAVTQIEH